MRSASALDDIVPATTDWARDGKLVHPRVDNFVDFDHGNVLIETTGRQYNAEVVVGITDKGESVFYDVVDIEPVNFTLKKQEPSTNVTTNESPDAVHEGSLANSIRKSTRNVNSIFENQTETVRIKQKPIVSRNGSVIGRMTRRTTQTSAFPSGLAPRSGRSGFCHTGKGSDFPYTKCPVSFWERDVLRIPKYSPVSLQFRCCCGIVSCRLCCPEATQG